MDLITLATSVVPDRSLGFTITVIVAGLGIVLGTLAVLIIVFYAFGAIMSKSQAIKDKKAAKKQEEKLRKEAEALANQLATPNPNPAPAPSQPVVEQGISGEVVAAISAAIYCMEGSGATIRTIKRQSPITARNPWAQASVVDNTRPF